MRSEDSTLDEDVAVLPYLAPEAKADQGDDGFKIETWLKVNMNFGCHNDKIDKVLWRESVHRAAYPSITDGVAPDVSKGQTKRPSTF